MSLPPEVWSQIFYTVFSTQPFSNLLRLRECCTLFRAVIDQHVISQYPFIRHSVLYHLVTHGSGLPIWQFWHSLVGWTTSTPFPKLLPSLLRACEREDWKFCQWLLATFVEPCSAELATRLIEDCPTKRGRSDLVRQLVGATEVDITYHTQQEHAIWAVYFSKDEVPPLQHVLRQLQLTQVTGSNRLIWEYVMTVCMNKGHTAQLQWLKGLFEETGLPLGSCIGSVFSHNFVATHCTDNPSPYQCLQDVFHLTWDDVRTASTCSVHGTCCILDHAAQAGKWNKVEWLVHTFDLVSPTRETKRQRK
jgi:hypothetical protein